MRPLPDDLRGLRHDLMGYDVVEAADGRSLLEWTPGQVLSNPVGFVHGGMVGVMVDDACGVAVGSILSDWRPFPTASLHVDFLRGIRVGHAYACRGVLVRAGRRLTVADATIHDGDGTLMARGTCHFALDLSDTDLIGSTGL
jgi:uncharacterized protein (TIGR00369 family)